MPKENSDVEIWLVPKRAGSGYPGMKLTISTNLTPKEIALADKALAPIRARLGVPSPLANTSESASKPGQD